MADREYLEYTIREIKKHRTVPYQMANNALADEMMPLIREALPGAECVKCGSVQWILAAPRARRKLCRHLEQRKEQAEQELAEIEKAISKVMQENG